jgi:hypothetical protein
MASEDLSETLLQPKLLCLSGQPLTSQVFFSDIVWWLGRLFTIKFTLPSRWYTKSFIHLGQLVWSKLNGLLDEMLQTQWINTNLFIWICSWQCEPFSEFIATLLKKKVTLLKEEKKRIINTILMDQQGTFQNNLTKQWTKDPLSCEENSECISVRSEIFLSYPKYCFLPKSLWISNSRPSLIPYAFNCPSVN